MAPKHRCFHATDIRSLGERVRDRRFDEWPQIVQRSHEAWMLLFDSSGAFRDPRPDGCDRQSGQEDVNSGGVLHARKR